MRISDKKMPQPLKAVIAVILFIVFCYVSILIIMLPYDLIKAKDYNAVIIGASSANYGINAGLLSELTDYSVINLAVPPSAHIERLDILEGAFEKYDLELVILEESYGLLEKAFSTYSAYNKSWAEPRLLTWSSFKKFNFEDAKIPWYDYDIAIGAELFMGLEAWRQLFTGNYDKYNSLAGSYLGEEKDMSFSEEEAELKHNTHYMNYNIKDEELYYFDQMLKLCEENNVRTIVAVMPHPESFLWTNYNWGEFRNLMTDMTSGYRAEYYDFDLIRDRRKLLYDESSFIDETHLSEEGSNAFSAFLAREIINKPADEINAEELFYNDFSEAKRNSRYCR